MLPEQKEEAEALRYGIVAGFATIADAVAWADRVILSDPRPDAAVLEVSLAGMRSPADMAALLREFPGEADSVRVMRRVLARMLLMLDADPGRAWEIARWLYRLAVNGELPEEHFGSEPFALDDEFELAHTGTYGTDAEALERLRQYLRRHSAPTPA